MKSRSPRPLKRTSGERRVRRIAVFAEGEKTEPGYLTHWYRAYRHRVQVDIKGGLRDPVTTVEEAIAQKHRETSEARRGRGRASDEYWCVIDDDGRSSVAPAVEKAEANGIRVAVSNPCIEVWFILHFRNQTAELDSKRAQAISKELLKCGKILNGKALDELMERFPEAKARVVKLDAMHLGDARPARSNPSSGMWRLIDSITGEAP